MRSSGVWKGSVSFGLLNIPVTLKTANEEKELHFSMLDSKDLSPIRFKRVSARTGHEVPYKRIVKGYEYDDDQYVIMTEADFRAANVKATQTMDIEDFVLLDDIDPMLFDKPYYVIPQKGAEKSYALLRDALERTHKVAVGKIVLRSKQHLALLMARGEYIVLEMLRFAHTVIEAHEADYLPKRPRKKAYSARELKMAEELIEGMTAAWDPEKYQDTYYDDIMKRIRQKVRSGRGKRIEAPEETPVEKIKPSKPTDLLPLLRESLAARPRRAKNGARAQRGAHLH